MLIGEFFKHFGTAARIRCIVFGHDLNRASIDAAHIIDPCDSSLGGGVVPTTIGRPNPGRVFLEPDLDRGRALGLRKPKGPGHHAAGRQSTSARAEAEQSFSAS